jgi:4-hydroxybenzoate polyprenyltransferase
MNMQGASFCRTVFKQFTDWVLYTSVFASVCAVALCMATERLILNHVPAAVSALHGFILGSALVVYNIHYLVKKPADSVSDRARWTARHLYGHYIVLGMGYLLCIAFVWCLPAGLVFVSALLGLLSLAYSLPLLPHRAKKRLKDFGNVKIVVLSGVWTVATAILPMLYWHIPPQAYPFELLLRFVLLFILCAAFDIRDIQTDWAAQIYTLPNRIGMKQTYRLIDFLIVLFVLLCIVQYLRYPSMIRLTGSMVTALLMKWSTAHTRNHPSDKAYLAYVYFKPL